MSGFKLYPEERHWWSFNDYGAVLDVMERLKPKTVLEFGPGSSTLALLEGGSEHIDTLEDDSDWADVYRQRLVDKFPGRVALHEYQWADPLRTPVDDRRYELALIDGPHGTPHRPAVIEYCLHRCAAVLFPTEDEGRKETSLLRPIARALAAQYWRNLEFIETGPLSGGFALLR